MNNILTSTKYVVDSSDFVTLRGPAIDQYAEGFELKDIRPWFLDAPIKLDKLSEKERVHFMLLFGALSFTYWGEPKWMVEYDNKSLGGSWGLVLSIKRALDEGIPILDADYLANASLNDIKHFLRGSVEIPMINERHSCANEVGKALVENYEGDFRNLLKQSDDVNVLRDKMTSEMKCFQDEAKYKDKTIYFHKRAQIVLAGVDGLAIQEDYANFDDPNELTALADYRIPQILRNFGILEYKDDLSQKVSDQVELDAGSPEETEIRANTVWAIELIRDAINKSHGTNLTAMEVNDHLWLETQKEGFDKSIHHRVRTTAY